MKKKLTKFWDVLTISHKSTYCQLERKKNMQLYALDSSGRRIFIVDAAKGKDYFCIECGQRVRIRSSFHRINHFFHLSPLSKCRLSQKSERHIQLQNSIYQQLGSSNCDLEVRFPEIGRIADVAWYEKKIVFEVQCSPISYEEITCRTKDYESVGWYVVWLLLDKTFLHKRRSELFLWLENRTFYFADSKCTQEVERCFYDTFKYGARLRFCVDLSTLSLLEKNTLQTFENALPDFLLQRVSNWRYCAVNDLVYRARSGASDIAWNSAIEYALNVERKGSNKKRKLVSELFTELTSLFYMTITLFLQWAQKQRVY